MMDVWYPLLQLLILIGAGQGIFLSFVLFFLPGENKPANRLLAIFLFLFSVNITGICLYELRFILRVPHLALVYSSLALLFSPFIYFYVAKMTRPNFILTSVQWLHALPFLVFVAANLPFFIQNASYKSQWLEQSYQQTPPEHTILAFATAIQGSIYLVLCFRMLHRYERSLQKIFSTIEKINLSWLRKFLWAVTAILGTCLLASFFDARLADLYSNLMFSIAIYSVGYMAIRQPAVFRLVKKEDSKLFETTDENFTEGKTEKYGKSAFPPELAAACEKRLRDLMNREKVFLNPELKLSDLAERLDMSSHHLSQLLNIYIEESFYDFINRHRVEEFKLQILAPENQHLSLLGVAFNCGFNSKAAFNNAFKKHTKMTPSQFRKLEVSV